MESIKELFDDGCFKDWKDHCYRVHDELGRILWRFNDGVLVMKDDPSVDKNDWRQCAIRRHELSEVSE